MGHVVAGRAQAVAVEGRAEGAAVGVGDGGRAVPGLHEHGLVAVEGTALAVEVVVAVPGLGHEQGGRATHGAAVHDEELEHVVEDGGVGALAVDDRQDLLEVGAHHRRVEPGLAGAQGADVALEGVDLAVVDDVAVGVRALPAGRGVGGVAGVHEAEGALHGGVVEVEEEAAHLGGEQHALVDHRARAHGAHVEDAAVEGARGLGRLLDGAAAHVEGALEVVAGGHGVRAADEGLPDGGHGVAGGLAKVVGVHGDLAPEQQRQAGGGAAVLEGAAGGGHAELVLGQEEHGHAVVALVGEQAPLLLGLLAEEPVGHLQKDAGAVAGGALEAHAAAVLEVDEDRQGVVDHLVAAPALDVGEGADAAGVVLELGAPEGGAGLRLGHAHSLGAGDLSGSLVPYGGSVWPLFRAPRAYEMEKGA